MNEYRVFQKAEVWYYIDVEADSEEQAIEHAKNETNNTGWEIDLETVVMEDEFEVYDR